MILPPAEPHYVAINRNYLVSFATNMNLFKGEQWEHSKKKLLTFQASYLKAITLLYRMIQLPCPIFIVNYGALASKKKNKI
jgi:hypothetical protein